MGWMKSHGPVGASRNSTGRVGSDRVKISQATSVLTGRVSYSYPRFQDRVWLVASGLTGRVSCSLSQLQGRVKSHWPPQSSRVWSVAHILGFRVGSSLVGLSSQAGSHAHFLSFVLGSNLIGRVSSHGSGRLPTFSGFTSVVKFCESRRDPCCLMPPSRKPSLSVFISKSVPWSPTLLGQSEISVPEKRSIYLFSAKMTEIYFSFRLSSVFPI